MKLTTTETLKYTAAVVKLSAGASLSRAEYDQFSALVDKMKQREPGRATCKTPGRCALAARSGGNYAQIVEPIAAVPPADLHFTTC